MRVGGVQAGILCRHAHQPAGDGPPDDAELEALATNHARKQRDDLDLHGAFYSSSPAVTTIVACRQIHLAQVARHGRHPMLAPPGARVTITRAARVSTKWLTVPSAHPRGCAR